MGIRSSVPTPSLLDSINDDSKQFLGLCDMIKDIHLRKAHDYGTDGDALGNFQSSERLGVQPHMGVFIRMQDKMSRLESYCKKGALMNESIEDNLIDLAAYSLLAVVVLRREASKMKLAAENSAQVRRGS